MALQEQSMLVGRLEPRHPLRHMITLRRRAKFIFLRMYVTASEFDSFSFSAILLASCSIVRVVDGPAPPMNENTSGKFTLLCVKYSLLTLQALQRVLLFSASSIRCSHFRHFSDSRYLYSFIESFGQELLSGLKIFTSKK